MLPALRFPHRLNVRPQIVERRRDLLLPRNEMLSHNLTANLEAFVKVQLGHLLRQSSLHVLNRQAAGAGMARRDDVEEMRIRELVEEAEVLCLHPRVDPLGAELESRIALYAADCGSGVVPVLLEVEAAFDGGEEGEEILFELEADELFATGVAHGFWSARVGFVPGFVHGLRDEVDPAAVGGCEC